MAFVSVMFSGKTGDSICGSLGSTQLLFRNAPHSGHFIVRFLITAPHEGHRIPSLPPKGCVSMPVAIYSALLSKKPRLNGAHPIRNYFKSSTRKYTGRWSCGDWQAPTPSNRITGGCDQRTRRLRRATTRARLLRQVASRVVRHDHHEAKGNLLSRVRNPLTEHRANQAHPFHW